MQQPTWSYVIPVVVAVVAFVGVVIGVVGQQAVEVWKTSRAHRQELQRRIFDAKFKTATEVSVILFAGAGSFRARLAAAEEWTRGDNRYEALAVRQQTLDLAGDASSRAFEESQRAFALMEFLFPPAVWLHQHQTAPASELGQAWLEFEEKRSFFKTSFDRMMPSKRFAELKLQSELDEFAPGVREEFQNWIGFYEAGLVELRGMLPRMRQLTDAYDVGTHKAIQILRDEFRQYER
jgi:hypothetical protein